MVANGIPWSSDHHCCHGQSKFGEDFWKWLTEAGGQTIAEHLVARP